MSVPALRQPKVIKATEKPKVKKSSPLKLSTPQDFLIVTLKDGKKLVVTSDAYHGILTAGELYRCVFCESEMVLDVLCKERHKTSQNHRKIIENYPHVEDYKENLIRKLTGTYYCTICNVVVLSNFLYKHLTAENHLEELEKAKTRAVTYIPTTTVKREDFPPLRK